MGKLFLVRHGETEANATGKLQGWLDAALSDKGVAQAEAAAEYFADIHIDAVYCSPLQRAKKTASIIAARKKLPLTVDANLKEVHFGIWEGHNHEEIDAMSHDEWARFFTDPKGLNIPEGESYVHVQKRMAGVWDKICKEQGPDKDILIVSHGGSIRTMICYLLGLDLNYMWRLSVDNVSTTCFEFWDGRPVMQFANFNGYLKEIKKSNGYW